MPRSAVAAAAGIRLQVGFQRRFDADFVEAKRRLDAGEVGELQLLRIFHRNRVPPHPGDLGGRLGGAFVDMTVHDFDTARWLAGDLAVVGAFTGASSGVVVARLESGALAVIDNTRAAGYGFECAVELLGARSTLRIGWSPGAAGVERLTPRGRVSPLPDDHVERHRCAYLEELRHFVGCIRSGTAPAVGGEDSVAALELSLAAERCLA